jgi:hypothetical protein
MACGAATGQVTRAEAAVTRAELLSGRTGSSLVRVPGRMRSLSTTALERRGGRVHSVARATVAGGRVELVGGAVRLSVLQPPTLTASISADGGAEISYVPAAVEVSGAGFATRRLDSAGDEVAVTLGGDRPSTEAVPAVPGDRLGGLLSDLPPDAFGPVPPAAPMTLGGLPPRSGAPGTGAPDRRPLRNGGTDDLLRISIGDVRQAMAGHAVAAAATAVRVEVVSGSDARGAVMLDLDIGVLEASAVAPQPATAAGGDGATGGRGGGVLPVSGPRVDLVMAGGVSLIVMGSIFLMFGLRQESFRI